VPSAQARKKPFIYQTRLGIKRRRYYVWTERTC